MSETLDLDRPTEKYSALSAHQRRQAFHRSIAKKAAALAKATAPVAQPAPVAAPPCAALFAPDVVALPPVVACDWLSRQKELWFSIVGVSPPRLIQMADIKRAVCDHFQVSHIDLVGAGRTKEIIPPRQIAMYLCREITGRSLPQIGVAFGGRDHTTVLHAYRKMQAKILKDDDLFATVEKIRGDLESML